MLRMANKIPLQFNKIGEWNNYLTESEIFSVDGFNFIGFGRGGGSGSSWGRTRIHFVLISSYDFGVIFGVMAKCIFTPKFSNILRCLCVLRTWYVTCKIQKPCACRWMSLFRVVRIEPHRLTVVYLEIPTNWLCMLKVFCILLCRNIELHIFSFLFWSFASNSNMQYKLNCADLFT